MINSNTLAHAAELMSQALATVAGIAALSQPPLLQGTLIGRDGVSFHTGKTGLIIYCYIVAQRDIQLAHLGAQTQLIVGTICQRLALLPVERIDVYIQDVEVSVE